MCKVSSPSIDVFRSFFSFHRLSLFDATPLTLIQPKFYVPIAIRVPHQRKELIKESHDFLQKHSVKLNTVTTEHGNMCSLENHVTLSLLFHCIALQP